MNRRLRLTIMIIGKVDLNFVNSVPIVKRQRVTVNLKLSKVTNSGLKVTLPAAYGVVSRDVDFFWFCPYGYFLLLLVEDSLDFGLKDAESRLEAGFLTQGQSFRLLLHSMLDLEACRLQKQGPKNHLYSWHRGAMSGPGLQIYWKLKTGAFSTNGQSRIASVVLDPLLGPLHQATTDSVSQHFWIQLTRPVSGPWRILCECSKSPSWVKEGDEGVAGMNRREKCVPDKGSSMGTQWFEFY